jgi:leader peptidase (prepilin peptidase)/N-methyltransferase
MIRFLSAGPGCALIACIVLQSIVSMQRPYLATAMCVAIAVVTVSAITDAQSGFIFDALTLPALSLLLGVSALHQHFVAALVGAGTGAGALGMLYVATRGRGLGLGDVKLSACIGAALGAAEVLSSLGVAFVLGGAYASVVLVSGRAKRGDRVHFAPYMALGMVLVILRGMHA